MKKNKTYVVCYREVWYTNVEVKASSPEAARRKVAKIMEADEDELGPDINRPELDPDYVLPQSEWTVREEPVLKSRIYDHEHNT